MRRANWSYCMHKQPHCQIDFRQRSSFAFPLVDAIMPSVTLVYPLLVVLLAVLAIAPLEYPGAFQSHTGLLAVYNLINLDQNPLQFLTWAPTVGQTFDWLRSDGALPYLLA